MNGGNFSPLFSTNAGILIPLCTAITKHSPLAVVLMVSNPQYSLPIAMKIFRNAGTYHWTRLFGVLSDHAGAHPFGDTLANEDLRVLIERTDDEGIELVQGTSGDAISIAYAGAMTADAQLSRLNDYDGIGFPFRGTSTGYHIVQQYSAPMSGLQPSETFPSDWDEVTMEELEEARQREHDKWGQDFDLDKHYPFLSRLPI